jgi:hypothetical protein
MTCRCTYNCMAVHVCVCRPCTQQSVTSRSAKYSLVGACISLACPHLKPRLDLHHALVGPWPLHRNISHGQIWGWCDCQRWIQLGKRRTARTSSILVFQGRLPPPCNRCCICRCNERWADDSSPSSHARHACSAEYSTHKCACTPGCLHKHTPFASLRVGSRFPPVLPFCFSSLLCNVECGLVIYVVCC